MATRVSARGMIGRSAELAELEAALSEAATGSPSIAFVAGESGLGKTRLLDELAQRARAEHGARVLAGDCVELGDAELPYAPLVTALRPMARTGDPVLETLRPAVRADLGTIALGLAPDAGVTGPRQEPEGPPQARLFEALLTLFAALSAETPLVLIIEDLHWADPSTRSFLTFLAANLCRERVLVVGSYRPDELHRRHPLRPLLAELERDTRARRIELSPMTKDELALQLADILGAEPDRGLVDRLYERSEGNPLFCEELLATGLDGRGTLPSTLRDALMVRVQRLAEPAQQVLRLLAVARTLDHTTLAATGPVDSDVLREAIEGHILITNLDGDYAFRHALLREVVDDDLLPGERSDLHHRLARALEEATSEPTAQRLAHIAHHYAQSGDQPAALTSAVRAAQAAMPVHAYGEAAALFERALELWERVPDAEARAGIGLVTVLELTANAYDMEGHNAREETMLRRALALAEASGDTRTTAGLLEQLSRAQWTLNRQDESLETLDRAMALMPDEPSQDRAWLLAGKARYLMLMGRSRSAVEAGEVAIAEARLTGARPSEGRAANALGVALMGLGDMEAGITMLRGAVDLAREDNRLVELSRALVNLSDILHLGGRTSEALALALEGHDEIAVVGRESIWLGLMISELAFDTGDWELAAAWLPEQRRRAQGTTLLNALLRRSELALGLGEYDAAGEYLDAADGGAEGSREPQFLGVLGALRAEYERRGGDLEAARAAVENALDQIEFCTDDVHRIARVAAVGVKVEAARGCTRRRRAGAGSYRRGAADRFRHGWTAAGNARRHAGPVGPGCATRRDTR